MDHKETSFGGIYIPNYFLRSPLFTTPLVFTITVVLIKLFAILKGCLVSNEKRLWQKIKQIRVTKYVCPWRIDFDGVSCDVIILVHCELQKLTGTEKPDPKNYWKRIIVHTTSLQPKNSKYIMTSLSLLLTNLEL